MKSKIDRWRRALCGCGVLASALLVSCGGGTQVAAFAPNRVIAFGDEASVIDDFRADANGRKYSINGTVSATDPTLDCKIDPLWIQVLANGYGLVFPQCNPQPNAVASPASRIRATPGARVADIAGQIDAQIAESPFTATDIATVLVGQNDILAQYAQYPTVGEGQLTSNVEAAGTALGEQINRIATTGAKVLVSTVPDIGLTPFGMAERAANTDTDRSALLTRLSARFNATMRATIVNDGRKIGLILTDEYFQTVVRFVGVGGFTNVTVGACDLTKSTLVPPSILDCTDLTLVAGATGATYVFADTTHFGSGAQLQLGTLALTRAQNNPF